VSVRKPHSARWPGTKTPNFVVKNRRIAVDTPIFDALLSDFSLAQQTKAGFRTDTSYEDTEGFDLSFRLLAKKLITC